MNWGFIMWFGGILITLAALKFLIVAFRSLFSKENMENVLDKAGRGISNANEKLSDKMKTKMVQRKQQKKEENRAIVVAR